MRVTRRLRANTTLFLGCVFACGIAVAGRPSPTISVCEALAKIDRYRGRIVAMRGWLNINWRHGVVYLSEEEDETPCPKLPGPRAEWPGWVLVTWPTDDLPDGPASFTASPGETWARLYYHAKKSDVGISVAAVIEGELRSRPGIQIKLIEGLGRQGNGYGRRGNFPAQLVIKRIVKIERPIKVY